MTPQKETKREPRKREILKWQRRTLTCPSGHSRSFTCYGLMYECHDCYNGNGWGRKFYFVKGQPIFSDSKAVLRADTQGIRELAKKFALQNGWASKDDPVVDDLTAFAESIVEQCAQIADERATYLKAESGRYLGSYGTELEGGSIAASEIANLIRSRW